MRIEQHGLISACREDRNTDVHSKTKPGLHEQVKLNS